MPFRYLIAFIFLIVSMTTHALPIDRKIAEPSPSQHWRTLSSEHFQFHFAAANEAYVRRLAVIAERVHEKLTPLLNWSPQHKTQVVVNDSTDSSNGASTPLPYDQLFTYMDTPDSGALVSRLSWMEEVFTHEYTHILHNDQAAGLPLLIRRALGSGGNRQLWTLFSYPQLWAPNWLSEGIAIYMESLSGEGRNHSAIYDGRMREEVRSGLNSLTQESYEGYNPARWPFGNVYLYGAYFFQFIEAEYGRDKVFEYITNYSDNLIPWQLNRRSKETFGISGPALWRKFQEYLQQRFMPQLSRILAAGETPGTLLTETPFINQYTTRGPDGSVFYYHADLTGSPEIRQTFPGGKTTTIKKMRDVTFLDWHPRRGLLIGQQQICNNTRIYTDILQLAPGSHSPRQITHCARIKHAVWAADDPAIFAVQTAAGKTWLSRVSLGGEITELLPENSRELIGEIAVSPDNRSLLLQVKTIEDGWNIKNLSLQTLTQSPLTHNHDIETKPRYGADGKQLYFLSDHNGQMELRKLDTTSGEITTLTNSPGYIIDYAIGLNNEITVSEYTSNGQRLRQLSGIKSFGKTYPAKSQSPSSENDITLKPDFSRELKKTALEPINDYSPLQTLRPFGWAPILNLNDQFDSQIGFQITGQDILGFHQWVATPLYFDNKDVNRFGGSLLYDYYDRILISGSRIIVANAGENPADNSRATSWDDELHVQVLIQKPWNHRDFGWGLGVGSAWEKTNHHNDQPANHSQDQITGVTFTFNNLKLYGKSISPTEGFAANITAESYDPGGHSDHQGNALITSLSGMFNLGGNYTLFGKLLSGTGDPGIKPFSLGEADDVIDTISGVTQLGVRRFALRGYNRQPQLTGNHFLKATAEWRFPIASIYDGFFTIPIGLGKIHGATFIDSATINHQAGKTTWYTGVGAEITAELLVGYDSFTLPVTIGLAQGLDSELGESNIYLRSGVSF